jgi:flagellar protein FliL
MAKKNTDGDGKKGGPKKFALPVLFMIVGAVVGPKVMGGGKGAEAAEATTTTTAPGPIVTLESITLNLADGHLLKLGMALQISAEWLHEHGAAGGGHGGGEETDPALQYPQAFDYAISIFSQEDMPHLMDPAGREAARTELEVHLEEVFHGQVEGVYFTEFVMQ